MKWHIEFFDKKGICNIIETDSDLHNFFRRNRTKIDMERVIEIKIIKLISEEG
jgi:hypothetical protein